MDWRSLIDQAEVALREGRLHDALQLCDRSAQGDERARYHAAMLRGDILLHMGDAAGALSSYESIADPDVRDSDVDLARGIALFELAKLPEADNALRSAIRGNTDLAEAHHTLGLIAELMGTGEEVECFRQARRLDPERYPAHPQLSRQQFEAIVEEALADLPEAIKSTVQETPVLVAEIPHPDDLRRTDPPVPPTSLGMFIGGTPGEAAANDALSDEKPTFLLFKRNLERAFPERARLIAELRRTVMHELGRSLGIVEDDT